MVRGLQPGPLATYPKWRELDAKDAGGVRCQGAKRSFGWETRVDGFAQILVELLPRLVAGNALGAESELDAVQVELAGVAFFLL